MIQEILRFGWLIVLFFLIWVLGAVGHELFHGLACFLQGSEYKIRIQWNTVYTCKGWKWRKYISDEFHPIKIKLPSMMCISECILTNYRLFDYLGGIGIGSTFILASLVFYFIYMPLFITLFLVGLANFFYGVYEGLFIRKANFEVYMTYHYILYLLTIGLGVILIKHQIWNWVVK